MPYRQAIGSILRHSFAPPDRVLPLDIQALLDSFDEQSASVGQAEFQAMMRQATPRLRAYARSLARDDSLADDLVQEAMLRIWAARGRFRAGTNFNAWTHTILHNLFMSMMRRRRFAADWDEAVAERKLVSKPEQEERLHLQDVDRALAGLSPRLREALVMVGADAMTYEEVAERLGVPLGTIKSRVCRARLALGQKINPSTLN